MENPDSIQFPFEVDTIFTMDNTPAFSGNFFRHVEIDREGYVWAGSNNHGLYRFNGNAWAPFPDNLFADHRVEDIARDANGGIWVGWLRLPSSRSEIGRVSHFSDTTFESVTHYNSLNDGLITRGVRSVDIAADGTVWSAHTQTLTGSNIDQGGVSWFDGTNWSTTRTGLPPGPYDKNATIVRARGTLPWVNVPRSCNSGDCFDPYIAILNADGSLQSIVRGAQSQAPDFGVPEETVTLEGVDGPNPDAKAILHDSRGGTWIGFASGGGLAVKTGPAATWVDAGMYITELDGFSVQNHTIAEAPDGSIWIGSTSGLIRYDPEFEPSDTVNAWRVFTTEDGLPTNNITGIAFTVDGTLWIATGAGLVRVLIERGISFSAPRCAGVPITFTDLSDTTTLVSDRLWEFGDTSAFNDPPMDTSRFASAMYTYRDTGTYQVTYTVTALDETEKQEERDIVIDYLKKLMVVQLERTPNKQVYEVMEAATVHYYLQVIDSFTQEPVKFPVDIRYTIDDEEYWSTKTDTNGIVDLKIQLGGEDPVDVSDDWVSGAGSYQVTFDSLRAIVDERLYPCDSVLVIENVLEMEPFTIEVLPEIEGEGVSGFYANSSVGASLCVGCIQINSLLGFEALQVGVSGSNGFDIELDFQREGPAFNQLGLDIKVNESFTKSASFGNFNAKLKKVSLIPEAETTLYKAQSTKGTTSSLQSKIAFQQDDRWIGYFQLLYVLLEGVYQKRPVLSSLEAFLARKLLYLFLETIDEAPQFTGFGNNYFTNTTQFPPSFRLKWDIPLLAPYSVNAQVQAAGKASGGVEFGMLSNEDSYKKTFNQYFDHDFRIGVGLGLGAEEKDKSGIALGLFDAALYEGNSYKRVLGLENIIPFEGIDELNVVSFRGSYPINKWNGSFVKTKSSRYVFNDQVTTFLKSKDPDNPFIQFFEDDAPTDDFILAPLNPTGKGLQQIDTMLQLTADGYTEMEDWTAEYVTLKKTRTYATTKKIGFDLNLSIPLKYASKLNLSMGEEVGMYSKVEYPYQDFAFLPLLDTIVATVEYPEDEAFETLLGEPADFDDIFLLVEDMKREYDLRLQQIADAVGDLLQRARSFVEGGLQKLTNALVSRIFDFERKELGIVFRDDSEDLFDDKSILTFQYPIGSTVFSDDTEVELRFFYPAGLVRGRARDSEDTLLVVSDIFFLEATRNGQSLATTEGDAFEVIPHLGKDDLAFLGLDTMVQAELFFRSESDSLWSSLGMANDQPIAFDSLGIFAFGVRLQPDTLPPAIELLPLPDPFSTEDTIRFKVSDNLSGIRWESVHLETGAYVRIPEREGVSDTLFLAARDLPADLMNGDPILIFATDNADNATYERIELNLNLRPTVSTTVTQSICEGESFEGYTATGTYIDQFETVDGSADSIRTLELTVLPASQITLSETICAGTTYQLGDSLFTESGNYDLMLQAANGCDSLVRLNLEVLPAYETAISRSLCSGEVLSLGDSTFSVSGQYVVGLTAANGCDSIVNVDLEVLPASIVNLEETICEGESYLLGDSLITDSGNYSITLPGATGCDSTVNLSLSFSATTITDLQLSICRGDSVAVGDQVFKEGGDYTLLLANQFGCDSIVKLKLDVSFPAETILQETICAGEAYLFGDSAYVESGRYISRLQTSAGCDSTVVLDLTVVDSPEARISPEGPAVIPPGGEVELQASGGTDYQWSTGSTDASIVASEAGLYSVTVSNSAGCASTLSIEVLVAQPPNVVLAIDGEAAICQGEQVSLRVEGDSSYVYRWNTGDTTQVLEVAEAGEYAVTITNAFGLSTELSQTIEVNELPRVTINLKGERTFCEGESAILSVTGAERFLWNTGDTTASVTVLESGDYRVTVTDENGCRNTDSLSVTVYSVPDVANAEIRDADCGPGTGAIRLPLAQGNYVIQWSNGADGVALEELDGGDYTVTVTDTTNCQAIETFMLSQTDSLVSAYDLRDASCYGIADGAAGLQVGGGTQPYLFEWSNGDTTVMADSLAAGSYQVTITDSKGCTDQLRLEVEQPPRIDIGLQITPFTNGRATAAVFPERGKPPYFVSWSNGETGFVVDSLAAGDYFVEVLDNAGCVAVDSFSIGTTSREDIASLIDWQLFPNPASEELQVQVHFENRQTGQLMLFDQTGRLVLIRDFDGEDLRLSIEVGRYTRGAYLAVLRTGEGMAARKILLR